MDKNEQLVMVVERNSLLGNDSFQGFVPAADADYVSRILGGFKFMKRGEAEIDPKHKQPISYGLIVNPKLGKVFAYKRSSKDKEYSEKRLHGKYSLGVGGHVEQSDSENPLSESLLREVEEEIGLSKDQITNARVLGYINDDSNPVGEVHFGLLYLIETSAISISPKSEMMHGELMDLGEVEELMGNPDVDMENWSRIAFGQLKEVLSSAPDEIARKNF